MTTKQIYVVKAGGQRELFSDEKVKRSLKNSGVDNDLIDKILSRLNGELYDGISTQKIYSCVFSILRNERAQQAPRYNLKHALMQLGPTGYPFEKFIGALLVEHGYKTKVGVIVEGKCVKHEVDVVAQKEDKHFMIECKFHNRPGTRSDVKVALYIKARFEDVEAAWEQKPGHKKMFHQAWLVTNTKLTSDAIAFGECTGMNLISWNYPQKGSLQDLIVDTGLHPVTSLFLLSKSQKRKLMDKNVILCRELIDAKTDLFESIGVTKESIGAIKKEAALICKTKQDEA